MCNNKIYAIAYFGILFIAFCIDWLGDFVNKHYDAIIAGAGLAGLSCAYELTKKGKSVLVIERHNRVGGRTSSFNDNGMPVESGLHRYIGYYSALPRLLKKCGVKIGDIVTYEEKADVLVKNKPKITLGLAPFFGPVKTAKGVLENRHILSFKDKMSLVPFFLKGFASYAFSDKLDNYTTAEYADKNNVTPNSKKYIVETLCSGIFFLPASEYSAYAFFGLFAPAIKKFYKMRIGAFLGGMTDVMCNPIADKIKSQGGTFLLGEQVNSVIIRGDRVVGVSTKNKGDLFADNVVVATSLKSAKSILQPLQGNPYLDKLFSLPSMSACTLQLELDKPAVKKDITTFSPETDLVSFAEQSRSTFQNSRGRLSVILGNADKYCSAEPKSVFNSVISQLKELGIDVADTVLDYRKVSEKDEFYSLTKGSQSLRPKQDTGIKGLALAGDYTLTPSFATMEGAVISGKKAACACL